MICPNAFDPDLTQTGNFTEKAPGEQLFAVRPVFCFLVLDRLFQQASHLCRCLFLHLACSVGVGGQCEPGAAVSQHAGHGFDINSILQGKGCEGVPKLVEAENGDYGIITTKYMLQCYGTHAVVRNGRVVAP